MTVEEQVRQGVLVALEKRMTYHTKRIADLTIEEYDSRGGTFLKRSPEVTSSERALEGLSAARAEVAAMDLSPLVKPA